MFALVIKNKQVALIVADIGDKVFWRKCTFYFVMYFLCWSGTPLLLSNVPTMDKIYFLVSWVDKASRRFPEYNCFDPFIGTKIIVCEKELIEGFGDDQERRENSIKQFFIWYWQGRWFMRWKSLCGARGKNIWNITTMWLCGPYACSLEFVTIRKTIDRVVVHLHEPPCPNKNVMNNNMDEILDIFWMEFDNYTIKTKQCCFNGGEIVHLTQYKCPSLH